jgi:hypothetical protein
MVRVFHVDYGSEDAVCSGDAPTLDSLYLAAEVDTKSIHIAIRMTQTRNPGERWGDLDLVTPYSCSRDTEKGDILECNGTFYCHKEDGIVDPVNKDYYKPLLDMAKARTEERGRREEQEEERYMREQERYWKEEQRKDQEAYEASIKEPEPVPAGDNGFAFDF